LYNGNVNYGSTCYHWNDSTINNNGGVGDAFYTNIGWTMDTSLDCDMEARLYCVSPAIVVRTWQGSGGDDRWTTPQNWVGDQAPAPGDSLVFPAGAARLSNTNDYPAGTVFGGLTLSGSNYTIGGNPFVVTGGLTNTADPAAPNVISANVSLPVEYNVSNVQNNGALVLTGAIGGNGAIHVRGTGSLTIAGPQNWGPGTTLVFGGAGSSAADSSGGGTDSSAIGVPQAQEALPTPLAADQRVASVPAAQIAELSGPPGGGVSGGEQLEVVAASTCPHPDPLPKGSGCPTC